MSCSRWRRPAPAEARPGPGRLGAGLPRGVGQPGGRRWPDRGWSWDRDCRAAPGLAVAADAAVAGGGPGDAFSGRSPRGSWSGIGVRLGPGSRPTHAAARKLAAIAEVARRNPEDGFEPGPGQMPQVVHEFTRDQLAFALGESRARCRRPAGPWPGELATRLRVRRWPRCGTGRIGEARKAGLIAAAHRSCLDPMTRRSGGGGEGAGPGRAADPWLGLRSALARAVIEVAPGKATAAAGDGGEGRPGGAVGRGLR